MNTMEITEQLLNMLKCPSCQNSLKYNSAKENLACWRCGKEYPLDDEIPVFKKE